MGVVLACFLGVMTTLAVSTVAAVSPFRSKDLYLTERDEEVFQVLEVRGIARERVFVTPQPLSPWRQIHGEHFGIEQLGEQLGMRVESGETPYLVLRDPRRLNFFDSLIAEEMVGWPLPAMRHRARIGGDVEISGGIAVGPATDEWYRAASLIPIWSGLVADTAIYTVLWALGITAIARARRARRIRRGWCPECGYDVKGETQQGCPECGWGRA